MVTLNAWTQYCTALWITGCFSLRATVPALPFTGGGDPELHKLHAGYGNAPEWMVDYPPINERIQAASQLHPRCDRSSYYRADGWTRGMLSAAGPMWTRRLAAVDWADRVTESSSIRQHRSLQRNRSWNPPEGYS